MAQETRLGSLAPTRFHIAVHALVYLARDGSVCPSNELADQVNSHATFVRRIIADLVKGGVVEAKQGRGGGYVLSLAPHEITLGRVYRLIHQSEANETDQPCLSEPPPTGGWVDAFTEIIAETEAKVMETLDRYTLADLLERDRQATSSAT